MAELAQFRPYVTLHAPGVPLPAVDHEVREAAILFCISTRLWKEVQTAPVVAGQADYGITPPDGAVLQVLDEVYHNRIRLLPRSVDQLRDEYEDWLIASGTPLFYTQLEPDTLRLVPIPAMSLAAGLTYRASYKPERTTTTVPDWLYEQYADAIGFGAIAALRANPNLPCYEAGAAQWYGERFQAGIQKTQTRIAKGFVRAPIRSRVYF